MLNAQEQPKKCPSARKMALRGRRSSPFAWILDRKVECTPEKNLVVHCITRQLLKKSRWGDLEFRGMDS